MQRTSQQLVYDDLVAGNLPVSVKNCKYAVFKVQAGNVVSSGFLAGIGKGRGLIATSQHGVEMRGPGAFGLQIYVSNAWRIARLDHEDVINDIAIISVPLEHCLDIAPLPVQIGVEQGKSVTVLGFHTHGAEYDLSVMSSVVSACSAITSVPQNDFKRWQSHHFCILDRPTDFRLSGSPVVSRDGTVIAMNCASPYEAISFALRAEYVLDALMAATANLPPASHIRFP